MDLETIKKSSLHKKLSEAGIVIYKKRDDGTWGIFQNNIYFGRIESSGQVIQELPDAEQTREIPYGKIE